MCTIEDCHLRTCEEMAEAIVFQKWHMVIPSFLTHVRERGLVFAGGVLDGLNGDEAADIIEKNDKRILHGVRMETPPSDIFPVNPQRVFNNLDTKVAEPMTLKEALCWLKYDQTTEILSVQLNFYVRVRSPAHFARYPFDRHVVPFELDLRVFRDASGDRKQWLLASAIPDWAVAANLDHYEEDRTLLSAKVSDSEAEFSHLTPWVLMDEWSVERPKPPKPVFMVRLQRSPSKCVPAKPSPAP